MKKTFLIIGAEIVLCILNLYTALYLGCESIMPLYHLIYDNLKPFYMTFLDFNGGSTNNMLLHYVPLLVTALLVYAALMFVYIRQYKKNKMLSLTFWSLALSIIPYIFWLVFVSKVTFNLIEWGDAQNNIYWVLVLFFNINIVFSIKRCLKIKKF